MINGVRLRRFLRRNRKMMMYSMVMISVLFIGLISFSMSDDNREVVTVNLSDKIEEAENNNMLLPMDKLELTDLYSPVEKSMEIGVDCYAINVDGKDIAYFKTEEEANAVISDLTKLYANPDAVDQEVLFAEDVKVIHSKASAFDFDRFKSKRDTLDYIIRGTNEKKIHKVKKGENFWVIAEDNNINVNDLIASNPGIEERKLQVGTELSLVVANPLINVVSISRIERIDKVPFEKAENVLTDKYYEGEYKVKQKGVLGEAEVIAEIYTENGKVIGEKIIKSTVIKKPVVQVLYQGTKKAPPKIGTGVLARPTSGGVLTSRFGARRLGYHYGIDIGMRIGTSIKASDGGVVKFAGWKGSYGRVVIINHGGNVETRYAHLSKCKVKAGEKVFKGQLIALSGNSGRSTGPHLHFEIRKNGKAVNPLKYVRY